MLRVSAITVCLSSSTKGKPSNRDISLTLKKSSTRKSANSKRQQRKVRDQTAQLMPSGVEGWRLGPGVEGWRLGPGVEGWGWDKPLVPSSRGRTRGSGAETIATTYMAYGYKVKRC